MGEVAAFAGGAGRPAGGAGSRPVCARACRRRGRGRERLRVRQPVPAADRRTDEAGGRQRPARRAAPPGGNRPESGAACVAPCVRQQCARRGRRAGRGPGPSRPCLHRFDAGLRPSRGRAAAAGRRQGALAASARCRGGCAMTALAHVRPLGHETIGDDHSRLKALLDNDFLVGAGWDWQTMVLSSPADHPTLGWPVCQVPGCEGMVEGSKGVCAACAVRMARSGSDELPDLCAKTWTVGVGLCAVGCARSRQSRRRPLCAAHEHQQGTVLRISIDKFLARPDLRPLPGFGPCRVLACTRLRYSGTSAFCKAHHRRWTLASEADDGLSREWWCRTESAFAEAGTISFRGLAQRVVVEVLFGLQQRCVENVKTHRAVLRPLCDELRRTQVGSLADLPEQTRRQRRDLVRSLVAHCRRGLSSPETEQAEDVWDLRVFGHRGSLDFGIIDLPWLRTAAKRWVAEDLPRRRGNNAPNIWQYTLSSLVELDTSLRVQRDDHGLNPPLLGRPDIVAFANRLAFLPQSGTLSLNRRIHILCHVRECLRTRDGRACASRRTEEVGSWLGR